MVALCLAVTQRQWIPSTQWSPCSRLRKVRWLHPRISAAARVVNQSRLATGIETLRPAIEPVPALLWWVVGMGRGQGLAERKTDHAQMQAEQSETAKVAQALDWTQGGSTEWMTI